MTVCMVAITKKGMCMPEKMKHCRSNMAMTEVRLSTQIECQMENAKTTTKSRKDANVMRLTRENCLFDFSKSKTFFGETDIQSNQIG